MPVWGQIVVGVILGALGMMLAAAGKAKEEKETNDRKIETAPDSPAVRLERLRQRVQDLQTKPPAQH